MSTRINYDASGKPLGRMLNSLMLQIESARNQAASLKRIADSGAEGLTWGVIESEFGVDTGQGEAVYNIVTALDALLNGSGFNDVARLNKG